MNGDTHITNKRITKLVSSPYFKIKIINVMSKLASQVERRFSHTNLIYLP